jgi:hypothetical protein
MEVTSKPKHTDKEAIQFLTVRDWHIFGIFCLQQRLGSIGTSTLHPKCIPFIKARFTRSNTFEPGLDACVPLQNYNTGYLQVCLSELMLCTHERDDCLDVFNEEE